MIIVTFLLNALFHHALFLIPQQEIPGTVPFSYVMRHPETGNVEVSLKNVKFGNSKLTRLVFSKVWWSPCPSRGCPEDEEINIAVDSCIDHCILLDLDPKINVVVGRVNDDLDDLNFKISKNKPTTTGKASPLTTNPPEVKKPSIRNGTLLDKLGLLNESESEESWVVGSDEVAFFFLDMHPHLGDAIERLGMEVEEDADEVVTHFIERFGEKMLWEKGVNVTELQDSDLR